MKVDLEKLLADDDTADLVGKRIIELLGLKVKEPTSRQITSLGPFMAHGEPGRVETSVGDKTPIGLARTVLRFLDPEQTLP